MSTPRVQTRPLAESDDLATLVADDANRWMYPWWQDLEADSGLPLNWLVGLLDGEPVGVAASVPAPIATDGYGAALLTVRRSARRQGVGTALRTATEDLLRGQEPGVPGVMYQYQEGDDDAEVAVRAWGLTPGARHHESVLDLTAVDRDELRRRAQVEGVEMSILPDLETLSEQDWQDLHAFAQERLREAPDAGDGGGLMPYEVFRSVVTEPWMHATARAEGVPLGVTFVTRRGADGSTTNTFFTGVTPSARGRGVAGALKAFQALAMIEAGVQRLYTQNMEGNAPILAANRSMGFVPDSVCVDVMVPLG